MSTFTHTPDSQSITSAHNKLSLRASLLKKLELYFPVAWAPVEQGELAKYELCKAEGSYSRFVEQLGGLQNKTVLDFGCGWGGETAWLAERAEFAFGCDINQSALDDANALKAHTGQTNLEFKLATTTTLPFEDNTFDAIFSTNVFEHVMNIPEVLCEIHRVLKPGGSLLTQFGPLFHSPLGYHLPWVTQVPYAHLVFGLKSIMEIRNQRREPMDVKSWQETGLNKLTFSQFRNAVRQSRLQPERLNRIPVKGLRLMASLPIIGNLVTFGIDCHLTKPDA